MFRSFAAIALVVAVTAHAWPTHQPPGLKSGPQADETLPGAFQPLNVNGPFAGRHHCLVTEFRLNPVAMAFVRAQADAVDPEVKKLLEALDRAADDRFADTGMRTFVVFLSRDARSGATEDKTDAKEIIDEAKKREKLVNDLKEFSKPFKRLIVACCPPEAVSKQYRLADTADVTVLVYANHHVLGNFAFAEGQLKQAGIDNVLKRVDVMLERTKKAPSLAR